MNAYQKKELNKLLAEVCFKRYGHRCLKCGQISYVQISHIYPKGKYRKLQFELSNLIPLCRGCHLYWWHKNPIEAAEWIKTILDPKEYEALSLRAKYVDKSILDFELLKAYLKSLLKGGEKK